MWSGSVLREQGETGWALGRAAGMVMGLGVRREGEKHIIFPLDLRKLVRLYNVA